MAVDGKTKKYVYDIKLTNSKSNMYADITLDKITFESSLADYDVEFDEDAEEFIRECYICDEENKA